MKKCPYCAEEIQDEAIKCKHCGEMLTKKELPKKIAATCPQCSKEYDNSWKVCLQCRVPLVRRETEEIDTSPIIICPTCKSSNVEKIDSGGATLAFGLLGLGYHVVKGTLGKSFICKDCSYKW